MVRLAMTVASSQSDPEDALQAAFLRVAARPKLTAKAGLLWPYLIRIARNEALRIAQKRRSSECGD